MPKAVQLRLGHKDIKITLNIYEHITKLQQEQTSMIIDSMYQNNHTEE